MIQELKVRNYLSFRDEITFSFEATKDTINEAYQVVTIGKTRLLRFAMVYGANASGKSNLLRAFEFLNSFWFNKADDIDEPTGAIPFRLDANTPNEPTDFSLKFFVGEVRYWYQLKLTSKTVLKERLFIYNSVQPTLLFERKLENSQSVLSFNTKVVKISAAAQEEISLKCLSNMSFFAARNQVNISIPQIDEAREWMRNSYLPVISPATHMFDYANNMMRKDDAAKTYLLDFIHRADFNITGLRSNKVSEYASTKSIDTWETLFEHTVRNARGEEKYTMQESDQSDGTKRTFGIEAAVYTAIKQQAFLMIDEIEASLHPSLVEFIIEKFLRETDNHSQMLITSHYDPLLNTTDDLIRKDSVWFTEKDETGHSSLFSLVEFRGLNKLASIQKAYRNGRFGALPNIK
ncbi:MAG: ATP-binding protein [Bacteroidales bacterium]|nr:ATP-binding protein [Bacteroidales bacterium]